MTSSPQIAERCPAVIDLPGLHAPCPCAELAAKFGTPPLREICPARESFAEMRRRHARDMAAARAATARALQELSQAVRDAESRADALEILGRRLPATARTARRVQREA